MRRESDIYYTVHSADRLAEVKQDIIRDSDGSLTDVSRDELLKYVEELDRMQIQELYERLSRLLHHGHLVLFNSAGSLIIPDSNALIEFFKLHPYFIYTNAKTDSITLCDENTTFEKRYLVYIACNRNVERAYSLDMSPDEALLAFCYSVSLV